MNDIQACAGVGVREPGSSPQGQFQTIDLRGVRLPPVDTHCADPAHLTLLDFSSYK